MLPQRLTIRRRLPPLPGLCSKQALELEQGGHGLGQGTLGIAILQRVGEPQLKQESHLCVESWKFAGGRPIQRALSKHPLGHEFALELEKRQLDQKRARESLHFPLEPEELSQELRNMSR